MPSSVERLQMIGVPVIWDLSDLAQETRLSANLLYKLSKFSDRYYKHFEIPKRDGSQRLISAPARSLRAVQTWILDRVLARIPVAHEAIGFICGHNTLDNASIHARGRFVLRMDIEDFFPSITYERVRDVFAAIGYNWHVSNILASLCTCEGHLPQGGVTSPSLSNIVCRRLDRRISGYARKHRISYSRYADDITLSALSPSRLTRAYRVIAHIFEDERFHINQKKTHLLGHARRRMVTGLVLHPEDEGQPIGIPRSQKKSLRTKIHRLYAEDLPPQEEARLQAEIRGWFAYLHSVDGKREEQMKRYEARMTEKHGERATDTEPGRSGGA